MVKTEVRHVDSDWAALNEQWEKEGRPAQFQFVGDTGDVTIWRSMQQPGDDYARFLLVAADAGTETGNEKPYGWVPRRGFSIDARRSGLYFRSTVRRAGIPKIRARTLPRKPDNADL